MLMIKITPIKAIKAFAYTLLIVGPIASVFFTGPLSRQMCSPNIVAGAEICVPDIFSAFIILFAIPVLIAVTLFTITSVISSKG